MNQEEGELRPHFLDRFGLCVNAQAEYDPKLRVEIVKRKMEYEKNPEAFCRKYLQQEEALKQQIFQARERLKHIYVTDFDRQYIVNLCLNAHIQGHRGDFIVEQTAKTLAALNGRTTVTIEDIEEAASLALLHRRKEEQPKSQQEESQTEESSNQEQETDSAPPQQPNQDELQNKQSQDRETNPSCFAYCLVEWRYRSGAYFNQSYRKKWIYCIAYIFICNDRCEFGRERNGICSRNFLL